MSINVEMIYIDLDGVGAAWESYMLQKYFPPLTIRELNDLPDRDKRLKSIYVNEPDLFYNLPVIHGYNEIIAAVVSTGKPWSILTANGGVHFCEEQVRNDKIRYVREHFGVEKENIIVTLTSKCKVAYAGPGNLLIDDYKRNTTEWDAAGGCSVLVTTETYDAAAAVKEILDMCS